MMEATDGAAPVFSRFNDFPREIRDLIWEHSMPDDEPELLQLRPFSKRPHANPTVYIAWPTAMHACREARRACAARLRLQGRLMPSPPRGGGRHSVLPAEVPYRPVVPDLDTLHVGTAYWADFFGARPAWYYGGFVHRVRRLVVDLIATSSAARLVSVALPHLRSLETLSVHVAPPGGVHSAGEVLAYRSRPHVDSDDDDGAEDELLDRDDQSGRYPTTHRRVRLRRLTDAELARTLVIETPESFFESESADGRPHPLAERLETFRDELEDAARRDAGVVGVGGDGAGAARFGPGVWDRRAARLRLRVDACTLEEYRADDAGRPAWRPRDYKRVERMRDLLMRR